MIGIIDYGSGNVKAIANIYKRLNTPYFINRIPEELERATHLVLPGVGAFDQTMNQLEESGLKKTLEGLVVIKKVPIIGICVGMQIMAESSEEGIAKGLGWIEGKVKKIDKRTLTKKPLLPHMGWNNITIKQDNQVLEGVDLQRGFYFLHSYFVETSVQRDVLATVNYGSELNCVVQKDNIIGVQFHPEKSHENGVQVFKNFSKI